MNFKLCSIIALALIVLFPNAYAHSAFNAQQEVIGNQRITISTNPEVPSLDKPTQIIIDVTDKDYNPLIDVRAGVKIFKNDALIHEFPSKILSDGHMDLEYTFPESGVYVIEVHSMNPFGNDVTAKFNIGVLQTFGYIFFSMVLVGAFFPAAIVGYVFFKRRKERKEKQR